MLILAWGKKRRWSTFFFCPNLELTFQEKSCIFAAVQLQKCRLWLKRTDCLTSKCTKKYTKKNQNLLPIDLTRCIFRFFVCLGAGGGGDFHLSQEISRLPPKKNFAFGGGESDHSNGFPTKQPICLNECFDIMFFKAFNESPDKSFKTILQP